MQLRWNACHSLAVVLPWSCSESLVRSGIGSSWIPVAFRAVLGALSSENFKVRSGAVVVWPGYSKTQPLPCVCVGQIRIAACTAITRVPCRFGYSSYYNGMATVQPVESFRVAIHTAVTRLRFSQLACPCLQIHRCRDVARLCHPSHGTLRE